MTRAIYLHACFLFVVFMSTTYFDMMFSHVVNFHFVFRQVNGHTQKKKKKRKKCKIKQNTVSNLSFFFVVRVSNLIFIFCFIQIASRLSDCKRKSRNTQQRKTATTTTKIKQKNTYLLSALQNKRWDGWTWKIEFLFRFEI